MHSQTRANEVMPNLARPKWTLDHVTIRHTGTQTVARVAHSFHSPGEAPVPHYTEFVASRYGSPGPVVMIANAHDAAKSYQAHVTDPGRFGDRLDASWVARFFAT